MTVAQLNAHLAIGATHVCQCWSIVRNDGVTFGFTDHDRPLAFNDITFRPDSAYQPKRWQARRVFRSIILKLWVC